MQDYIVLAGPTLDRALSLVRFGLVTATPSDIRRLERSGCTGSQRRLKEIQQQVPPELRRVLAAGGVHLMVPDERDYHHCGITYHLLKSALPEGSFMQLCEGVLVPAWPLYYMLKCREIPSLSARLMLGMELCGSYGHTVVGDRASGAFYHKPWRDADGKLTTKWNYSKIEPATTVAELQKYLQQQRGVKGLCRAREATRYLLDGSASPCESALALMATLPCKLGGYGFAGMELNPTVKVRAEKRHLTRSDTYHPDGYLCQLETDLEYESDENHSGPQAVRHDKARRNDIQALGIEVKDVTWEMLSHLDSLDLLFEQLLQKEFELGFDAQRRHRRSVRNADNKTARAARLHELLPPLPYEE